jgi:hypothetical protein
MIDTGDDSSMAVRNEKNVWVSKEIESMAAMVRNVRFRYKMQNEAIASITKFLVKNTSTSEPNTKYAT